MAINTSPQCCTFGITPPNKPLLTVVFDLEHTFLIVDLIVGNTAKLMCLSRGLSGFDVSWFKQEQGIYNTFGAFITPIKEVAAGIGAIDPHGVAEGMLVERLLR